ncbi:MAG: hypothetical protein LC791_12195 [Acidobacteria bacterium]|nr:hypothetical protein [Acidobacteriota bacterium]
MRHPSDWLISAAIVGGGALALIRLTRGPSRSRARRQVLAAYLTDHHAGAQGALALLARLRQDYGGTALGHFLDGLERDIREDRRQLEGLITHFRVSTRTLKRAAARVGASVLAGALAARGREDLALLEALESLALGVQGKRCLWRAMNAARISDELPNPPDFVALERRAVDQWERIERHRLEAARPAFAQAAYRTYRTRENLWRSEPGSATAKAQRTSTASAKRSLHSTPAPRRPKMPPDDKASSRWMT